MDRGAWWATVHGVSKSWTRLSDFYITSKSLVMYILDNKSDSTRVGISVSKKVGNAINRNKVRRRIRESYRLNVDANVKYGYDIVFIARVAIKEADYKDIEKSMSNLIKKAGLI